jgi:membrane protease YdiL (CAAX protease family)
LTEPSRPADPPPPPAPPAPTPPEFGLTTFTIDGRQAPALFVVGWLATVIGVGLTVVVALGAPGLAGGLLSLASVFLLSVGLILLAGSQTLERRAAGAAYAGPSPWLVFLTIVAVSRLLGSVIGAGLQVVGDRIPIEVGDLLGAALQAVVFMGVLRLSIVGPGVLRWSEMGWVRDAREALRGFLLGAVFAGPVVMLSAALTFVLVQIVGVVPPSPLPPTGTTSGLVLHLIAGAVIAPISEEALFRGFAVTAWRRTLSDRAAIARASVLFVLAHVLFVGGDGFREAASLAIVAGGARLPVAIALGWLYVRTGSIWAPIGLHAAYNAVLIVLGELATS